MVKKRDFKESDSNSSRLKRDLLRLCIVFYRLLGNPVFDLSFIKDVLFRNLTALLAFKYHRPVQENPDSGIGGIFACGIWNPGPWYPESHYLKPACSALFLFQAL